MPGLFCQPSWYRREPNAQREGEGQGLFEQTAESRAGCGSGHWLCPPPGAAVADPNRARPLRFTARPPTRSEEHTSELQSRGHLVCRLLLEKKKKTLKYTTNIKRYYTAQPTHCAPAQLRCASSND